MVLVVILKSLLVSTFKKKFRNQYVGKKVDHFQVVKNGKQNEDEVDSLSGATITSKAMTNGINGALDFYDLLKGR